jgi:hypothetical protein
VAIAAAYQTTATFTTSAALYTTSSSAYQRDLVITNSGTATCYVAVGAPATSAATTSSFVIPTGGSVILTQCQIPASTIIYGVQAVATTTSQVSIGFGSLVSYV